MRTGMLADKLLERGHKVRWWVSGFEHQRKQWWSKGGKEVNVSKGLSLHVLRGCGYRNNISLARYLDHRIVAWKFRQQARRLSPPDLVVASMPCHHLAYQAVNYTKKRNVPILVDIRDCWPDIFLSQLRRSSLRSIGRLFLLNDFVRLRIALAHADGLLAVSEGYLHWALKKVGRKALKWDRVFFLGYKSSEGEPESSSVGMIPDWLMRIKHKKIICYVGTFGITYDLDLILQVARAMQAKGHNDTSFVIAGTGEQEKALHNRALGLSNVCLTGWIGAGDIKTLLKRSYLGLLPYVRNAPQGIPNKPFEYLSAGLPLVSSIKGEMADLIERYGLGLNYKPGDADDLCNCIDQLLDNQELRRKMAENAIKFFQQFGDAEKIYSDYAQHIEQLVEVRRRSKGRMHYPSPSQEDQ